MLFETYGLNRIADQSVCCECGTITKYNVIGILLPTDQIGVMTNPYVMNEDQFKNLLLLILPWNYLLHTDWIGVPTHPYVVNVEWNNTCCNAIISLPSLVFFLLPMDWIGVPTNPYVVNVEQSQHILLLIITQNYFRPKYWIGVLTNMYVEKA